MSTRPRPKPEDLRLNRERDRVTVDTPVHAKPEPQPPAPAQPPTPPTPPREKAGLLTALRERVEPLAPARSGAAPWLQGRLRKLGRPAAIVLLAAFAWTAWAGYALYDLATAVQSLDPVALERRVDWVAVQQGLREDLAADSASSSDVTRQSVARAVRSARFGGAESNGDRFWSRIGYAGYTGGPFTFRVDLKPDGGAGDAPMILLFKWSGDWRLARVFLPDGSASPPAPFAQRADVFGADVFPAPPPAPAQPSPTGAASSAPKAVLFEEDSTDPQGRRYDGTVRWQTELSPSTAGRAREPVVRADVTVAARSLAMTMWIRRNTDKTLPASHTIEVKFDLPADSPTGGIQDVPAVMLKPGEDARGTRLAGIRVNVAPNFFLIGLSGIEHDVEHNVRMLRERPWFDIPVAYKSRSRAVLAIEKGPAGEKIIADALDLWSRTSLSEQKR
jgi:hypothetical protein